MLCAVGQKPTRASVGTLHRDCFPKPNHRGSGCKERDEPDYELYIIGYLESHSVGVCTTL